MLLRAFAKINRELRILGRRADGYHEIRTVFQTIDWFDEIHLEPSRHFEFVCQEGPADASNLVVRAVREFEAASGEAVHARVELVKRIPIGAGLGGGSADAAVTLLGLQRFCGRDLPGNVLEGCLRSLGSDVPFFAVGGRALGTGRGDEVMAQEDDADFWLVIVVTQLRIRSVDAYSWLTVQTESNTIKGFGAQVNPGREAGPPGNDFEPVVFGRHPVLGEIKNELRRLGAKHAALSGSGSAVFGQFDREKDARQAADVMGRYGIAQLTRPLARPAYLRNIMVG